jgi:hypothetical protein
MSGHDQLIKAEVTTSIICKLAVPVGSHRGDVRMELELSYHGTLLVHRHAVPMMEYLLYSSQTFFAMPLKAKDARCHCSCLILLSKQMPTDHRKAHKHTT